MRLVLFSRSHSLFFHLFPTFFHTRFHFIFFINHFHSSSSIGIFSTLFPFLSRSVFTLLQPFVFPYFVFVSSIKQCFTSPLIPTLYFLTFCCSTFFPFSLNPVVILSIRLPEGAIKISSAHGSHGSVHKVVWSVIEVLASHRISMLVRVHKVRKTALFVNVIANSVEHSRNIEARALITLGSEGRESK